jgi:hypothetical protein
VVLLLELLLAFYMHLIKEAKPEVIKQEPEPILIANIKQKIC